MRPLHEQHTLSPKEGLMRLEDGEIKELQQQLTEWEIAEEVLQQEFRFKDYYQTLAFVNAVGWIAHQQDHHPELLVNYNRCLVRYTTHAVNGISLNDFICAARIEKLQQTNA